MKDRSITIDISLPEFQVLKYRKTETVYQIWLESRDDLGICPTCGHPTSSYHDSYERIIQDLPIMGIPVFYTSSRKDITVLTAENISVKNPPACWGVLYFLRCWYNAENLGKARKLLSYWMYQVKRSGIPEFLKLAKTIKKWRKEILNYFRAFLTSGPVEAIINKIKLIKRITYGLPNFEHLRARILIECGRPP